MVPNGTCSSTIDVGATPGLVGGPEHLLEVEGLAGVDHVEGLDHPHLDPVVDGGEVGGPVQVAAVRLGEQQRRNRPWCRRARPRR